MKFPYWFMLQAGISRDEDSYITSDQVIVQIQQDRSYSCCQVNPIYQHSLLVVAPDTS